MHRSTRNQSSKLSAHRRLYAGGDVDDPLTSVANLFDVAMVFAVALLLALVSQFHLPKLLSEDQGTTIVTNPGKPNMEIIHRKGLQLEHFRMTTQTLGGEGEKLGTAYRLKTGEVVYVPEE